MQHAVCMEDRVHVRTLTLCMYDCPFPAHRCLQEVHRSVSAFAASWKGSLSAIVQALEGSTADAKVEGGGDVDMGAAADCSSGKSSSSKWCAHVAQELDSALNEELTMPVVWEHSLRKQARTGVWSSLQTDVAMCPAHVNASSCRVGDGIPC